MYWTCQSCGSKNPENARTCGKCGKSAATKKFYPAVIVGGTLVYLLIYVIGTGIGGTLVAFALEPPDEAIVAMAKTQGADERVKTVMDIDPKDQRKAKDAVIAKAREEMPVVVHSILYWIIPFLLFPICGIAVGYVSSGRTVLEASLAATGGQVLGFVFLRFMNDVPISFIELVVGVVVVFGTTAAGAYVGEAIQEKRERAVLTETEAEEAEFAEG